MMPLLFSFMLAPGGMSVLPTMLAPRRWLPLLTEVVSVLENVPTNRYVKRIMLGGDVFQPSFVGRICEVELYNEAKRL